VVVAGAAPGGHSRHSYVDAGRSSDGRYTVTVELVEDGPSQVKNKPPLFHWQYTWKDATSGKTHAGKLAGLRRGSHEQQVHAHVFVAPGGETFAVWNPQAIAFNDEQTPKPPKDFSIAGSRDYTGFSHRLTVYKKTGEVVKRLDVKDFLKDDDWNWLYTYGCQVYWQLESAGLSTKTTPRAAYALYRISPDYSVLETTVGPNQEAGHHAKAKGVTLPAPRVLRIDLTTGEFLDEDVKLSPERTPGRPFKGPAICRDMEAYRPSLDPVREEGTSLPVAK
jgi:hypothetical protein